MKKLSWSKWSKYKIMRQSESLKPFLPETATLSTRTLRRMLDRYGAVVVKPTAKCGGAGVFRIVAESGGNYAIRWERRRRTVSGLAEVMRTVRSRSTGSALVQRYIRLATVAGRPFDARVMVQRGSGRSWAVTGKLAKVAGPGYIVTNRKRSKGYVTTLPAAIRKSSALSGKTKSILRDIDRLALRAADRLSARFPWVRNIGLDVGIDRDGRIWIIEANFRPDLTLFAHLKDKTMYRNVVRAARGGGSGGRRRARRSRSSGSENRSQSVEPDPVSDHEPIGDHEAASAPASDAQRAE